MKQRKTLFHGVLNTAKPRTLPLSPSCLDSCYHIGALSGLLWFGAVVCSLLGFVCFSLSYCLLYLTAQARNTRARAYISIVCVRVRKWLLTAVCGGLVGLAGLLFGWLGVICCAMGASIAAPGCSGAAGGVVVLLCLHLREVGGAYLVNAALYGAFAHA